MNRQSWEDAPAWAQYRTTDNDGERWYFENEPQFDKPTGQWQDALGGRCKRATIDGSTSIELRPE